MALHTHNNNNNQNHLTRYEFNRKLINRSLSNIKAYSDQTGFFNTNNSNITTTPSDSVWIRENGCSAFKLDYHTHE